MYVVEVPHRRKRLFGRIVNLDERGTLRQPHGLEIIQARAQHGALEDIARQPLLLPLGDDDAAAEMSAGREAREIERVGIAAKAFGVTVHPADRAATLVDHWIEVAREVRDVIEFHVDEDAAG